MPSSPSVLATDTTGSASSQIFPTGSLNAPSPYTMTSTCFPVRSRTFFWISVTKSIQSRGNSLMASSVDLLEPRRPYFSLQPLPSTGAFRISSIPHTTSAPASFKIRLVRIREWISQVRTRLVWFKISLGLFANITSASAPCSSIS